MIGVGDGPWTMMSEFDDQLPERRFDNFQFVNYNTIPRGNLNNPDGGFAMQALMEIPGMSLACESGIGFKASCFRVVVNTVACFLL